MADGDGVLWPKLETGPLFVSLQLGATKRKRDGWSVSITLWGSYIARGAAIRKRQP